MPPSANRFLSQSSLVQRDAPAQHTAVERLRRSSPLALERSTPPYELTRHNLPKLEKCTPRQGLARCSLSLEQERCTLPHVLTRHTLQELE